MKLRSLSVFPSLLVVLSIVLACSSGESPAKDGQPSPPPDSTSQSATSQETSPIGIDVSHFQGTVVWSEVAAAGYSFAFAKASEGVDVVDADFAANWQGMAAAGLLRGAYHFFRGNDDGGEQARNFLSVVDSPAGDSPTDAFQSNDLAVVDLEVTGGVSSEQVLTQLRTFLAAVEQRTGRKMVIYTDANFWNSLGAGDEFSGHPLWIAEYDVDEPKLPNGWNAWTFWQRDQDSDVPGVSLGTDGDVFAGTAAELEECFRSCGK